MIEFFELLNGCSPFRTITYLLFIIIMTFIVLNTISIIIDKIFNRSNDLDSEIIEDVEIHNVDRDG